MVNISITKKTMIKSDLKHFNLFLYHFLHTLLSKSKISEISQSKPSLLNPCFSLTKTNEFVVQFLREILSYTRILINLQMQIFFKSYLPHNDTWHFLRLNFPVFSCAPINPCASHSPLQFHRNGIRGIFMEDHIPWSHYNFCLTCSRLQTGLCGMWSSIKILL